MSNICNIIPIIPCYVMFVFKEAKLKLTIHLPKRQYKIIFYNEDDLNIWQTTINSLSSEGFFLKDDNIVEDMINNIANKENKDNFNSDNSLENINYLSNNLKTMLERNQSKAGNYSQLLEIVNNIKQNQTFINDLIEEKESSNSQIDSLDENYDMEHEIYVNNRWNKRRSHQLGNSKMTFMEDLSIIEKKEDFDDTSFIK